MSGEGPTVLCIGAQRAGTTWLYRCLSDRPDVWLPPVKELHFFDEKIGSDETWFDHLRGGSAPAARWRRQVAHERQRRSRSDRRASAEEANRAWTGRYFFEPSSVDWYRSLFPPPAVPSLDTSPEYALLDEEAIARVIDALPDVRIVYLLRNPIEREWSGAQMRFRSNPARGPESVLEGRHPHVRYMDNIDRWQEHLPDGRLYIGFFDDIANRPGELLADLLRFIGADDSDVSLPPGKPNSGNLSTIPAEYALGLARVLRRELDGLAERFGGPAAVWAATAEWIRTTEPTGDLPYPFEAPPSSETALEVEIVDEISSVVL